VAKERKATEQARKIKIKAKAEEDASWEDEETEKYQKKKEEKEAKRLAQLKKKQERKALEVKENQELTKKAPSKKITKADLEAAALKRQEVLQQAKESEEKEKKKIGDQLKIEKNTNRLAKPVTDDSDGEDPMEVARSVEEAIEVLKLKNSTGGDKHPEKRLKSAYVAYEEANLAKMKLDNPTLKRSQLKQLLWKEWQKSPDNPLNQN